MTKAKTSAGDSTSRRKFLSGAAVAAAATVAAPSVVKAQGPISMRWQSTWPSKDIFHEYAQDFAKKVNDMTGGDLKIEVLPGGRRGAGLRPARRRLEGHARRRPRRARLSLRQADGAGAVGLGPRLRHGRQHAAGLAQVRRRQGAAREALRLDRRRRRLVPVRADADAAARLVQEADHQGRRLQGPQVPHRRHLDRRVHRAWAPRSTRCRAARSSRPWTAACSTRPSSTTPRPTGRSASPTSRRSACCRASTRTPSSSRSCSTRTKYDALPDKMKAIIANAVEAASQDMPWKAIDRYSQDYIELQTKDNVKFYKTPDAILKRAARGLRRGRQEEGGRQSAVQGDPRVAARLRQARDALGAGHGRQPPHGLRPLLRAERAAKKI